MKILKNVSIKYLIRQWMSILVLIIPAIPKGIPCQKIASSDIIILVSGNPLNSHQYPAFANTLALTPAKLQKKDK